jgi:hypothetical protein
MTVSTLSLSAGAWLFLRSRTIGERVLSITGGYVSAAIINGISWATWDWQSYYGLPRSGTWYENLGISPIAVFFWLLFLIWPAAIDIFRGTHRSRRAVRP